MLCADLRDFTIKSFACYLKLIIDYISLLYNILFNYILFDTDKSNEYY